LRQQKNHRGGNAAAYHRQPVRLGCRSAVAKAGQPDADDADRTAGSARDRRLPGDVEVTPAEKAKARPANVPRDGPDLTGPELEARLHKTWSRPRGLIGWLSSV